MPAAQLKLFPDSQELSDAPEAPVIARYYFSRAIVPSRFIKTSYKIHKIFWRAFPSHPANTMQPFLFREVENESNHDAAVFLLQSAAMPRWEEIPDVQAQIKSIELPLRQGDLFYFRLLASPVANAGFSPDELDERSGKRKRGKKLPMRSRKHIAEWFERQSEKYGFESINHVFSIEGLRTSVPETTKHPGARFHLSACQFDGQLRVTDPSAFGNALYQGVGPKKAFGFGMLSVAR
ncbi:MAG: type I-E CRISPR-associated protein Cas6/Cse3/CasE [Gammaproteobacteria bacterium]|nr:type I-E CRISPR-associated protein Cas6/Cse3/CasE [Gammaproteobacteria bacterium]